MNTAILAGIEEFKKAKETTVKGVIQMGLAMLKIKAGCGQKQGGSDFAQLVKDKLDMSAPRASGFCTIGENSEKLFSITKELPNGWYSIAAIARLTSEQIQAGIDQGLISSKATQEDIISFANSFLPPEEKPARKARPMTKSMREVCRKLESGENVVITGNTTGSTYKLSRLYNERPEVYARLAAKEIELVDAYSILRYEAMAENAEKLKPPEVVVVEKELPSFDPDDETLEQYLKKLSNVMPKKFADKLKPEPGQLPSFVYQSVIQSRVQITKALEGLDKPTQRDLGKRLMVILEQQHAIFDLLLEDRVKPQIAQEKLKYDAELAERRAEVEGMKNGNIAIASPLMSLTKMEVKKILGCLHPDRAPEGREKQNAEAFNMIKRVTN